MVIWAHALIRNEARWLWFSVNSVIEHVDKLLLYDTGSTDETLLIEEELCRLYPKKIIFKKRPQTSSLDFAIVRQEMLDATESDWFLMVDGDEIWWQDSIKRVIEIVKSHENTKYESIVVPTINAVGDIFHFQDESYGKYKFGSKIGHYNLRAINRNIPGLHSQGVHGVWGWADSENKMIQDRQTFKFVDAPYIHTTFLPRASNVILDRKVVKRKKKLKYEIGNKFPLNFYYPEVFFEDKPDYVLSPWYTQTLSSKIISTVQSPLRKIKRYFSQSKVGY